MAESKHREKPQGGVEIQRARRSKPDFVGIFQKEQGVRVGQADKRNDLGPHVNSRDYCLPQCFETNIFKYNKTNISFSHENNLNKLMIHSNETKYIVHN